MHLCAELILVSMMLEPLGEVGANFSLLLSSRTQFTKINNKKVIAENQCEKHKKSSLTLCMLGNFTGYLVICCSFLNGHLKHFFKIFFAFYFINTNTVAKFLYSNSMYSDQFDVFRAWSRSTLYVPKLSLLARVRAISKWRILTNLG